MGFERRATIAYRVTGRDVVILHVFCPADEITSAPCM